MCAGYRHHWSDHQLYKTPLLYIPYIRPFCLQEVKEGGLPTRDVERSRLHADLLWKIKVLRKEDPAATADRAIDILEEGRVEGVSSLEMYRAVFIVSNVQSDYTK